MINPTRLIQLTQKVISINSENPPGNELALSRFVEKDLRSLNLSVKTYSYAPKRPNVIATLKGTWPRKKAAREALILTPHIDTVPISTGWSVDPLGGKIKGKRIYGRGATDDKGNLASSMEVMRSLVEDGVKLKRDVVLAATADEETGSHYGIIPLLDKRILQGSFALVLDSDEFDTIITQKGLLHCRIQIFGKKAHGAYNWRGINAIELATQVIQDIKKLKFKYKKHPLLRGPTTNIGVIKGGDKVNMVPDFCEFALDFRFVPGMNPKEVLKRLKRTIARIAPKYKIIIDALQDPYGLDRDHPAVKTWVQIARRHKCTATVKGCEGATVITFFKKHNIPAFATGFGAHGTAHTNDEFLYVDTLIKGTKVLENFVKEYDKM